MNDALDPILQQEAQRKLKVQLAWRLGIAATLIVLALFGINWLDQQASAPSSTPTPIVQVTAAPTPEALPLPTTQATASEVASSVAAIASTPAAASSPAVASSSDSGLITGATQKSTATPSPSSKATLKLEAVTPEPHSKVAPSSHIAPPATPTAPAAAKPEAPIITPHAITPPTPAAAAQHPDYPAAQHSPNGYTVQAGVFLQAQNAGKLLSQLKAAGIPAYTETRVQIGPFKDKATAEAAAAKLKRMGIDPIVRGN
jgi:DedD protein